MKKYRKCPALPLTDRRICPTTFRVDIPIENEPSGPEIVEDWLEIFRASVNQISSCLVHSTAATTELAIFFLKVSRSFQNNKNI